MRSRGSARTCRTIFSPASLPRSPASSTAEREVARHAVCRRGDALCLRRHRHADLCRLAGRRLGQGARGVGNARRADACSPTASFAPGPIRRLDDQPGHDRRHVADAAVVARLCRGANRPTRTGRRRSTRATSARRPTGAPWSADCALARRLFAAPALATLSSSPRTCPGAGVVERRRTARLRAAERLDRVPRDLHLQDGPGRDGGGRRPSCGCTGSTACASSTPR